MKVHRGGLTKEQWDICISVSSTALIVNWFMKCVPDKFFPILGDEDPAEVKNAEIDYLMLKNRKIRDSSDIAKTAAKDLFSGEISRKSSKKVSVQHSPQRSQISSPKVIDNSLQ